MQLEYDALQFLWKQPLMHINLNTKLLLVNVFQSTLDKYYLGNSQYNNGFSLFYWQVAALHSIIWKNESYLSLNKYQCHAQEQAWMPRKLFIPTMTSQEKIKGYFSQRIFFHKMLFLKILFFAHGIDYFHFNVQYTIYYQLLHCNVN